MDTQLNIAKAISDKYILLPKEELTQLQSIIEYREVPKGELLLSEGQVTKHIFYVQSGMLRQFYYKGGRDITEHFTTKGFLTFCIVSLFKQEPTQLMIEALEDSSIYSIEYRKLEVLSIAYPLLAKLLRGFLEISLIISQEKADSWRFETAKERYERFIREYPEAAKRASVNHIASYLLMTPESLSRIRAGKM